MNSKDKKIGLSLAIMAAIFFGVSAISAKLALEKAGGSGISIAFYRNVSVLPVLAFILWKRGCSFKLTLKQLLILLAVGLLCGGLTAMTLYLAYQYISVGLTMCLHFSYPLIVVVIYAIFFKERPGKAKIISLAMALGGIWVMSFAGPESNMTGMGFALCSALAYAAYLVVTDKSGIKELDGFTISFYNTLFGSLFLFIFGRIAGHDFGVCKKEGWVWLFITGLLVAVLSNAMTPEAVKRIGPAVTGILGILEPISGLVLSIVFLNEPFGARALAGGVLVLGAAFIITLDSARAPGEKIKGGNQLGL